MPFKNPIVAGVQLVLNAIQSKGFLTGVQGWSINRDGTAEFQEVKMRGAVTVGPDGMGVVATDEIPPELVARYPDMVAVILLYTTPDRYVYWGTPSSDAADGTVRGSVLDGVVTELESIVLSDGELRLLEDGTNLTVGSTDPTAGTLVRWLQGTDVQYAAVSQPRGFVGYEAVAAWATVANTSEQVVYTTGDTYALKATRAYRGTWRLNAGSSPAVHFNPRVRVGSLTGTNIISGDGFITEGTSNTNQWIRTGEFISETDQDVTFVMTVQAAAAQVITGDSHAAPGGQVFEVVDIGSGHDYQGAPTI